jgi:CpeT protein
MKYLFMLFILFFAACESQQETDDLALLKRYMTGTFNSARQAQSDSDYFDIRLDMQEIWQGDDKQFWLYVEQAVSAMPDRPYRQRVYQVKKAENNRFVSVVYRLPGERRFINTSSGDPLWQSLTLDSLLLRKGCAITLTQKDSLFTGATTGKACTSSLRGATYATSVVTIEANKLVSWDRGFNGKDEQVWGAEKGAYIFDRIK